MSTVQSPDRFLTRREVAQILCIEPQTLAKMAMVGRGPRFFKDGKIVRYRQSDVAAYLDRQTIGAVAAQ